MGRPKFGTMIPRALLGPRHYNQDGSYHNDPAEREVIALEQANAEGEAMRFTLSPQKIREYLSRQPPDTVVRPDQARIDPDLQRSGATIPICQNGVRPGATKLAQFELAMRYAKVPVGLGNWDEDTPCRVKLWDPSGSWTWYVLAWSPTEKIATCLVNGFELEAGDVSLEELATTRGAMGIGIELDNWWKPRTYREVRHYHTHGHWPQDPTLAELQQLDL